jgi:hypothetical protein
LDEALRHRKKIDLSHVINPAYLAQKGHVDYFALIMTMVDDDEDDEDEDEGDHDEDEDEDEGDHDEDEDEDEDEYPSHEEA